jgi:hypothetical protein
LPSNGYILFLYCFIYGALHSNGSYPIVACVFFIAGTYMPSSCSATGLHVTILYVRSSVRYRGQSDIFQKTHSLSTYIITMAMSLQKPISLSFACIRQWPNHYWTYRHLCIELWLLSDVRHRKS